MGRADNENLGVAFALVAGAGAATGLGAAVVFVPALVRLASRKTLASSLGLSAGVMTYVSFVEILAKSLIAFENAGHDADDAYIYASLCFFAGVIFMLVSSVLATCWVSYLLDSIIDFLASSPQIQMLLLDLCLTQFLLACFLSCFFCQ